MADVSTISLPHAAIPTSMFGNCNMQTAIMYCNENFAALVNGANSLGTAIKSFSSEFAAADHDHDDVYSALSHTHAVKDVIGLQVALDGKADLNHLHNQYLTSMPVHYHGISEISGLNEQLAQKADRIHRHRMDDVDGLNSELSNKARIGYVDGEVAKLSEAMKGYAKISENTFGIGKPYPTITDLVAAMTPKDAIVTPENPTPPPDEETDQQKQERIGTSAYAARADHKHVMSSGNENGEDPGIFVTPSHSNDVKIATTIGTAMVSTVNDGEELGTSSQTLEEFLNLSEMDENDWLGLKKKTTSTGEECVSLTPINELDANAAEDKVLMVKQGEKVGRFQNLDTDGCTATPKQIAATMDLTEGDGSSGWDRGANPRTGVTLRVCTRCFKNVVDNTVYCVFRELTFDSHGRLKKVSTETPESGNHGGGKFLVVNPNDF